MSKEIKARTGGRAPDGARHLGREGHPVMNVAGVVMGR